MKGDGLTVCGNNIHGFGRGFSYMKSELSEAFCRCLGQSFMGIVAESRQNKMAIEVRTCMKVKGHMLLAYFAHLYARTGQDYNDIPNQICMRVIDPNIA